MNRLRPARLIVALAMVFIFAGIPGIASARSTVTDGFHLIGTDAAYVRFVGPVDACHGFDLFVGYVQADGLQSPIGDGRPHFHTDVDAFLTVTENAETEGCGSDQLNLMGGRPVIDSDQVEIVALESATMDGFELTVTGVEGDDAVTVVMTLDFAWTAEGDVFTETNHGPGDHSAHRTVAATVSGNLMIESVGGDGALATALSALAGQGPVTELDQTEGAITHYQQVIVNIP
jgi:hypothetical protein